MSRLNKSLVSSAQVLQYILDVGISKVKLSVEDIESILDTLVFDSKVEKRVSVSVVNSSGSSGQTTKLYRYIEPLAKDTGFMRMPCSVCPVYNDCREGTQISPSKCTYFVEWFDMWLSMIINDHYYYYYRLLLSD